MPESRTISPTPMTFDSVEWSGRRLVIDPSSTLEPILDEEAGLLYLLVDEELGIDVFAPTRDALADELAEQILFQWDAYAREDEARLTPGLDGSARRRCRG